MPSAYKSGLLKRLIAVAVTLAVPVVGYAQEATLNGVVTDATMAVLPGVSIKALHQDSGNTFEAVTDQRGAWRVGRSAKGRRRQPNTLDVRNDRLTIAPTRPRPRRGGPMALPR